MKKSVMIVLLLGFTCSVGIAVCMRSHALIPLFLTPDQSASENQSHDDSVEDEEAIEEEVKGIAKFYSGKYSCASVQMEHFYAERSLESLPVNALRAELRNIVVRSPQRIEADFVLLNTSKISIRLVERWNSWGAYQWSFHFVDKAGIEHVLENPQCDWTRNFFSTFEIEPLGEQVTRCRIELREQKMLPGVSVKTRESWPLPATITGVFRAKQYPRDKGSYNGEWTNWAGSIQTTPISVRIEGASYSEKILRNVR